MMKNSFTIDSPSTPKLDRFVPLPKQKEFLMMDRRFDFFGYIGGWGAGKTIAGCVKSLLLASMYPGNVGLVARNSFPQLRDTTMRTFRELTPDSIIKGYSKTDTMLELVNGSVILFRHLGDENLKSLNLGFFYIDEAVDVDEQIFYLLVSRLRLPHIPKRVGFFTTNPGDFSSWIYRLFINPTTKKERFGVVFSSTLDNTYLPEGYRENLLAALDDKYAERYIHGKFNELTTGRVYFEFSMEKNVSSEVRLLPDIPLHIGMDFNVNPMAATVTQDVGDELWVVDEIYLPNSNSWEMAREITKRFKGYTIFIYPDATGAARSTSSNLSNIEILKREFGFTVLYKRRNPDVTERVNATNKSLRRTKVAPWCRYLIRDLLQVVYREQTGTIDKTTNPELTHISDALGYERTYRFPIRATKRNPPGFVPEHPEPPEEEANLFKTKKGKVILI